MIGRLVSLLMIVVVAFALPWWAVLIGVAVFCMRFSGFELIPLMALIDGYYGVLGGWPLLTMGTVLLVGLRVLLVRRERGGATTFI